MLLEELLEGVKMNTLQEKLLQEIRDNFTSKLKDENIFIESASDIFEIEPVTKSLFYENWHDIPLQVLIDNRNIISYLNLDAFHFYLPAILSAIITHPRQVDTLVDSTIFHLSPSNFESANEYSRFLDRVNIFTQQEIEVIAKFFDSYFDLFPLDEWSHSNKHIKEILETSKFWSSQVVKGI